MTKSETRRPTLDDFHARRPFCCVHLEASEDLLEAKAYAGASYIEKDRGGNHRIGSYGTIEHIELGVFCPLTYGTYHAAGVLLDYAENLEELLNKAEAQLEELRQTFLARLAVHQKRQASAPVIVLRK